jgi:hypothetical protein
VIPVSLPVPVRQLGSRQVRKLDRLAEEPGTFHVVGWDERREGPLVRLAAFPDGRYVIDRRGQLRPVA